MKSRMLQYHPKKTFLSGDVVVLKAPEKSCSWTLSLDDFVKNTNPDSNYCSGVLSTEKQSDLIKCSINWL